MNWVDFYFNKNKVSYFSINCGWRECYLVSIHCPDMLRTESTGVRSDAHISIPLKVGKRYRLTASISLGPNLASVKYMAKNPNDGTSPANRIMNNEQGTPNFEIALNQ